MTITNPDLQVCRGDACTSITPQVLPNASKLHATTNADGTFAVVLLGDAADLRTQARGRTSATAPASTVKATSAAPTLTAMFLLRQEPLST